MNFQTSQNLREQGVSISQLLHQQTLQRNARLQCLQ